MISAIFERFGSAFRVFPKNSNEYRRLPKISDMDSKLSQLPDISFLFYFYFECFYFFIFVLFIYLFIYLFTVRIRRPRPPSASAFHRVLFDGLFLQKLQSNLGILTLKSRRIESVKLLLSRYMKGQQATILF